MVNEFELNPGSEEAVKAGCLCPVYDNNMGAGIVMDGEVLFWRTEECPLHGTSDKNIVIEKDL